MSARDDLRSLLAQRRALEPRILAALAAARADNTIETLMAETGWSRQTVYTRLADYAKETTMITLVVDTDAGRLDAILREDVMGGRMLPGIGQGAMSTVTLAEVDAERLTAALDDREIPWSYQ